MSRKIMLLFFLVSMVPVQASWGGWLEDAVGSAAKQAVEKVINRGTEESSDAAYDKAKEGVKTDSQEGAVTNSSGSSSKTASSGSATADEQVYSKYDFIPGDKVIFFDDFSDTDVGEFPRKWTIKGPEGGGNSVEVVEYQGKRFLRSNPADKGQAQWASTQYIRFNRKGDLPERFTVEFDAVFAYALDMENYPSSYELLLIQEGYNFQTPGIIHMSGEGCTSANTETRISKVDGKVHHIAVSVNGTFVKAYVDHQRVVNDPDAINRPINLIGLRLISGGSNPSDKVMVTNFRLAEGGKDIKSALATDGRIVTHGILFDTGKETIKPESLPTLKMILGVLDDDPGLKFSIEGHTDNQGNQAINQPLSEKRAAAVKAWLVDKGIDAGRLATKGLGDTRPLSSNDTAEGRANNRRVEFVRL